MRHKPSRAHLSSLLAVGALFCTPLGLKPCTPVHMYKDKDSDMDMDMHCIHAALVPLL